MKPLSETIARLLIKAINKSSPIMLAKTAKSCGKIRVQPNKGSK